VEERYNGIQWDTTGYNGIERDRTGYNGTEPEEVDYMRDVFAIENSFVQIFPVFRQLV
jgi:hypothetical protein